MADWEAKKVHDVIQDINDHIVVLPVIQRNLVWEEEKMELLFDSLLKGNSFGGIMALVEDRGSSPLFAFRHFSKEGELQDSDLPPVLDRNTMLIIDGQQRLQSFYMGLCGGVNGKKLYFNLFSQDDFDFDFARQISDLPQIITEDGQETTPLWYPATDLYNHLQRSDDDREVARDIIANRNIEDEQLKERIYDNVRRFERAVFSQRAVGISKVYIKKTDPENERQRMVELFRRLNDGGTRLSALDLAASTLKGFDYRLETFLRRDIPRYADIGFGQDEVVKLLFLLQDNHSKEVTQIGKEDADFAIENTQRILCTLNVLRQLLKDADLYEYFRSGGRSIIPLYFIAYHIFHKDKTDQALADLYVNYDANNPDFTNIKRWLYLSLLNGVFSRGKGWIPYKTGIHKILNIIQQYKGTLFPTEQIFSMYGAHPLVFSQDLSVQRLPVWDMSFVFYLIYNCRSLAGRDIDHIQPKSLLEAARAAPEIIHSVGNYQLLDEDTNRASKRAKEFKLWINGWDEAERNQYLARHLIPQNPELWSLENFDAFILERSQMIVEKIKACIPAKSVEAQPIPKTVAPSNTKPKRMITQGAGAVWATRDERDPETWLCSVADQNGFGNEFRQIVASARSLGLYARFQNNWWIVMFTPSNNRSLGLIELGTKLNIWINIENITGYIDCTAELVREKLGTTRQLSSSDIGAWIENLKGLFPMGMINTVHQPQVDIPPHPIEFDREALIRLLPNELQSHPILADHTTWDDHFIKGKYGGPAWSRRISGELDRAGIYTVGDMALLIILLGLRVSEKTEWGNVYIFDRALPSGEKPFMRTKNFGAWSWKIALQRLQAGGFDWEEYVAK